MGTIAHSNAVQLWIEGGGLTFVATSLFYLGRSIGRLDSTVKGLDKRLQLVETREENRNAVDRRSR